MFVWSCVNGYFTGKPRLGRIELEHILIRITILSMTRQDASGLRRLRENFRETGGIVCNRPYPRVNENQNELLVAADLLVHARALARVWTLLRAR